MSQGQESSTRLILALALLILLGGLAVYYRMLPSRTADLPNTVHVQGTVKFKGQPLKMGLIVFEPDVANGGSGAQGFAAIRDGSFDTNGEGGQSVSKGACIARVTGGDGVGIEAFTPFGNMLFEEFSTPIAISDSMPPLAIDVPASKGFKTPEKN